MDKSIIKETKFSKLIELVPKGNRRIFAQIYFNKDEQSTIMEQIIDGIYNVFGIESSDFYINPTRIYHYNLARQIYWFCMRSSTPSTLAELGNQFGKDHATVLNGIRKVQSGYRFNKRIRKFFDAVLLCVDESLVSNIRQDLMRDHDIKKNIKVVYLPKGKKEIREYKRYQDADGYWHENIKII